MNFTDVWMEIGWSYFIQFDFFPLQNPFFKLAHNFTFKIENSIIPHRIIQ